MRLKSIGSSSCSASRFHGLYWFTDRAPRVASRATGGAARLRGRAVQRRRRETRGRRLCALPWRRRHGRRDPDDPAAAAPSLHTASLAQKLKVNPDYVRLAVSYGGVVVSGNVNSPMPAWSSEVGGPLNVQQIEAVVQLVTSWAVEAGEQPPGGSRHGRGGRGGLQLRRLRRLSRPRPDGQHLVSEPRRSAPA